MLKRSSIQDGALASSKVSVIKQEILAEKVDGIVLNLQMEDKIGKDLFSKDVSKEINLKALVCFIWS